MQCSGVLSLAERCHSVPDHTRSIWHGTDDRHILTKRIFDVTGGDRGGDGNDKLLWSNLRTDLLHDTLHGLRLHANKNNVGVTRRGCVFSADRNAQLLRKYFGAFLVLNRGRSE